MHSKVKLDGGAAVGHRELEKIPDSGTPDGAEALGRVEVAPGLPFESRRSTFASDGFHVLALRNHACSSLSSLGISVSFLANAPLAFS